MRSSSASLRGLESGPDAELERFATSRGDMEIDGFAAGGFAQNERTERLHQHVGRAYAADADGANRGHVAFGMYRLRRRGRSEKLALRTKSVGHRHSGPMGGRRAFGDQTSLRGEPRLGDVKLLLALGQIERHGPEVDLLRAQGAVRAFRTFHPLEAQPRSARGGGHHLDSKSIHSAFGIEIGGQRVIPYPGAKDEALVIVMPEKI